MDNGINNKQAEETPKVALKSFMASGPTLHYSHDNVLKFWLLSVATFGVTASFWSKVLTGSFWILSLDTLASPKSWYLGQSVITGVSIFEYPWQILVLGLLMGILAVAPVLVSQLTSFIYCLPFILAVVLPAGLPGFAICLLVSSAAAACRPLRFRSRFISIVLCTAPQLFYWGYFGGARGLEPLKFGYSFLPWICAWLISLAIAGLVLGIGHFTRYRPGLIWMVTTGVLLAAIVTFRTKIGLGELDYQLYVANNNPELVEEFQDLSITDSLDKTMANPAVRKYLTGFFYPTEPIPLRAELKAEIQVQLGYDRWPNWFLVPDELDYQTKKQWLLDQYDLFITQRRKSRRMPIALYYKALLNEYSPDIELLGQKEVLHFYSDCPYERSRQIWYRLYSEFSQSPESLEARWRIAKHWAAQGRFEQADNILAEAQVMLAEQMKLLEKQQPQTDTMFSPFRPPVESAMTAFKLSELQMKLSRLRSLISTENRTNDPASEKRLAQFVMLNPHSRDYGRRLDELLKQMKDSDPLRDNVLLAQVMLIPDEQLRADSLYKLHKEFQDSDGGMDALHELALLQASFWRQQGDASPEQKKKYLLQARATLTTFISLYPDSIYIEQTKKNLEGLPSAD
jgi:hypothetical protein